jgi:hypothetical protein
VNTPSPIPVVSAEEAQILFAEIEEGRDRLEPVEQDIADNLKERPYRAWCKGCHKMLRVLHAKASGKDWRALL